MANAYKRPFTKTLTATAHPTTIRENSGEILQAVCACIPHLNEGAW